MGTLADKLGRVLQTKEEIKQAIINKGVEVSDTDTFASYSEKIAEITSGGEDGDIMTSTYTITPTQADFSILDEYQYETIEAPFTDAEGIEYDGVSKIKVRKIGSWIDSNISTDVIKEGTSILGIPGRVVELKAEGTKTVNPSTSKQTIKPSGSYNSLSEVVVNPVAVQGEISVSPSTSSQTIKPTNGNDYLSKVIVNPVTSSIDKDITAENIKKGVSILGVEGSYEPDPTILEPITITPTTSPQTFVPTGDVDGYNRVAVNAVTSNIDANIQSKNIKRGVSILGVEGTYRPENLQDKIVNPMTVKQTITYDDDSYEGLNTVVVNPVTAAIDNDIIAENIKAGVEILGVEGTYQGKTYNIEPTITTTPQTTPVVVKPSEGYDYLSQVNIEGVTASIDPNILAENIKKNIQILGVTGTLETDEYTFQESKEVEPGLFDKEITPDDTYDALLKVIVKAVTASIDPNILPKNIKKNVQILGVTGELIEGEPQRWLDLRGMDSFKQLSQKTLGGGSLTDVNVDVTNSDYELDNSMKYEGFTPVGNIGAALFSIVNGLDDDEAIDPLIYQTYILFVDGYYYTDYDRFIKIPNQLSYMYPFINDLNIDGCLLNCEDTSEEKTYKVYVLTGETPKIVLVDGNMSAELLPEGYVDYVYVREITIPAHKVFVPTYDSNELKQQWILKDEKNIVSIVNDNGTTMPLSIDVSASDINYGESDLTYETILVDEVKDGYIQVGSPKFTEKHNIYNMTKANYVTSPSSYTSNYFDLIQGAVFMGQATEQELWFSSIDRPIGLINNKYGIYQSGWIQGSTIFTAGRYWFRAIYDNGKVNLYYIKDAEINNTYCVGTPQVDGDFVFLGAQDSHYLYTNFQPGKGLTWEIMFKVKTPEKFTSQSYIYGNRSTNRATPQICTNTSGNLLIYLASGTGSWNIANGKASTTALLPSTDYYIRTQFTGTQYLVDVKTTEENAEWVNYITISSSTSIYSSAANQLAIGMDSGNSPWLGQIYLKESYIIINNDMYWQPVRLLADEYYLNTLPKDTDVWTLELSTSGITNPFNNVPIILSRNNDSQWKGTMDLTRTQVSNAEGVIWQPYDYGYRTTPSHNITPLTYNMMFYNGECGYWDGKKYQIVNGSLYNYVDDGKAVEMPVYVAKLSDTKYEGNYTAIGNLTFNSKLSQLNGITSSSYAKIDTINLNSVNTWEMNFKILTSDDVVSNQKVFHTCSGTGSSGRYGLCIAIKNEEFYFFASSTNSSWMVDKGADDYKAHKVLPNTIYYLKMTFDGSKYELFYSLDGETYNLNDTYTSTAKVCNCNNTYLGIYSTSSFQHPLLGAMYLKDCNIILDGKEVWRGAKISYEYEYDYDKVGSPTIDEDDVASNFVHKSNYIRKTNITDLNTLPNWEFGMKMRTPSSYSGNNYFLQISKDSSTGNGRFGLTFGVTSTGFFHSASTNGTSWDLAPSSVNSHTPNTNTDYYIKWVFDGEKHTFSISLDGEDWIILNEGTGANICSVSQIILGDYNVGASTDTDIGDGKIYLRDVYIKSDGEYVWRPCEPIITTKLNYILSPNDNIENEGLEILGQIGTINIPDHKLLEWTGANYREYKYITLNTDDENATIYAETGDN
jgi:hypothetical protein